MNLAPGRRNPRGGGVDNLKQGLMGLILVTVLHT